jgi:hypothetical protein
MLYTVRGWVDRFKTWQVDLRKKFAAGQDVEPGPARRRPPG